MPSFLSRLYPDPFYISHSTLRRVLTESGGYATGTLLDIGCGREPYRALFSGVEWYVGIDLPSTGYGTRALDVLGDAHNLPFGASTFDTVLCTEVLEHVPEPSQVLSEVNRVLKPGGVLILTVPLTWGLHEAPHDYYRYTEFGVRYLVEKAGFSLVVLNKTCGVWAAAGQRTAEAIYMRWALRSPLPLRLISLGVLLLWQRAALAMDAVHGHWGDTLDYLAVARKSGQAGK